MKKKNTKETYNVELKVDIFNKKYYNITVRTNYNNKTKGMVLWLKQVQAFQ